MINDHVPLEIYTNHLLSILQYIPTVPTTYTMTVKKIGKGPTPQQLHIVGSYKDQYKQLEGSREMMCELLDLQEPQNDISDMNQFIPFQMTVTTEGVNITMMEIPQAQPAQPHHQNASTTNTSRTCFNPIPGYCDVENDDTNKNTDTNSNTDGEPEN